jgi:hypothetical protein
MCIQRNKKNNSVFNARVLSWVAANEMPRGIRKTHSIPPHLECVGVVSRVKWSLFTSSDTIAIAQTHDSFMKAVCACTIIDFGGVHGQVVAAVNGAVFVSSVGAVVLFCWTGLSSLYYIIGGVLLEYIIYLFVGQDTLGEPSTGSVKLHRMLASDALAFTYLCILSSMREYVPCIHDRIAIMRGICTSDLFSSLDDYRFEMCTDYQLVFSTLYLMDWEQQQWLLHPQIMGVFSAPGTCSKILAEMETFPTGILDTPRVQRVLLMVLVWSAELYPCSAEEFELGRWNQRVGSVLRYFTLSSTECIASVFDYMFSQATSTGWIPPIL